MARVVVDHSRSGLTNWVRDSSASAADVTHLYLYDNELSELPDAIGDLTGLQVLDLAGNRLRDLPSGVARCADLEYLYLHGMRWPRCRRAFVG